uniref:Uncharacterized protein n=1 Tax=Rhizophora mucronata TaxID=61149 RepID=A0A2P2M9Z3_RHIMU
MQAEAVKVSGLPHIISSKDCWLPKYRCVLYSMCQKLGKCPNRMSKSLLKFKIENVTGNTTLNKLQSVK